MIARLLRSLFRRRDPFAVAMRAFDAERDEARRRHLPIREIEARRRAFTAASLARAVPPNTPQRRAPIAPGAKL